MKLESIKDFFVTQYGIITSNRFGIFGAVILIFFAVVAILAPWIAPHDLWEPLRDSNGKLAMLRPPSLEFPLGTTAMGRDILSQMILATRTTFLIGLVSGLISIIIGANIFRDIFARVTDVIGGRSGAYEKSLMEARDIALRELEDRARAAGGNAVVGVDLDYEVVGADGGMLMVSASGTAVVVE